MTYNHVDLRFVDTLEAHKASRYCTEMSDSGWFTRDSDLNNYGQDINFPDYGGRGILSVIIESYLSEVDDGVAIDLAGGTNGRALKQLINEGHIATGLVTNFQDNRNASTRANASIHHIDGDLFEFHTWDKIVSWARANAPAGVDLILHRPEGALQFLPPSVYGAATLALLEILKPGGILFAQIPLSLTDNSPERKDTNKLRRICQTIANSGLAADIIRTTLEQIGDDHAVIIQRS